MEKLCCKEGEEEVGKIGKGAGEKYEGKEADVLTGLKEKEREAYGKYDSLKTT